jgi:hypothetical protein
MDFPVPHTHLWRKDLIWELEICPGENTPSKCVYYLLRAVLAEYRTTEHNLSQTLDSSSRRTEKLPLASCPALANAVPLAERQRCRGPEVAR